MASEENERQLVNSKDGGATGPGSSNRHANRSNHKATSSTTENPVYHQHAHKDKTESPTHSKTSILEENANTHSSPKSLGACGDDDAKQEQVQELAVRAPLGVNSPRRPSRRRSGPYYNKMAMEVMKQEQQGILAEADAEEKHEKELREMGLVKRVEAFLVKCIYGEQGEGYLDSLFL